MIKKKSVLITCLVLTACLCIMGFTGCEKSDGTKETAKSVSSAESSTSAEEPEDNGSDDLLTGMHHVTMEVQNYGTVSIELNADKAPVTVTNFIKLAQSGFYDGLTFHRIFPDQFVQGGDPLGNGRGNSGETIKGEFAINGSDNDLSHTVGAIAMARSSASYDSGSCQFFIDLTDMSQTWDGQYAVFGYVTDGLDLLKQMSEDAAQYIIDQNGSIQAQNQPVITSIKVID